MKNKLMKTQIQKFIDTYQEKIEILKNIIIEIDLQLQHRDSYHSDIDILIRDKQIARAKIELSEESKIAFEILLKLF